MDEGARGLRISFSASVAKDADAHDQNEDCLEFDEHRGVLALSDGAGESFDPKWWAGILVEFFVSRPDVALPWLDEAIEKYLGKHDREGMSWSGQAAFDRGSFATLLGVQFSGESGAVEVLAVGDSLAVLLDGEALIESFPYIRAEQFSRRPTLLGTNREANRFLSSPLPLKRWSTRKYDDPAILCMTDALGAWLLEQHQERCKRLRNVSKQDKSAFQRLVRDERASGRLRLDDTTLVVLEGR
jgi:hypothetical protein